MLADRVLSGWALPAWASRTGFRLLDPVKSMRSRIDFIMRLHDREALLPREGQRRFLEAEGWAAGVRAIRLAAPRAQVYELALHAGHLGLVVGSRATSDSWPAVAGWARWRAGDGELPAQVTEVPDKEASLELSRERGTDVRHRVVYGVELAGAVGTGMVRSVASTAERTARGVRELALETAGQLPRLEQIQPSTRISLGCWWPSGAAGRLRTCSSCSRIAPTPLGRPTSGSTTWCAG